jgi:hypothetical protein
MSWIRVGWVVFAAAALAAAQAPKFEVASIKACKPGERTPGAADGGGNRKSAPGPVAQSPGRLAMNCYPLTILIQTAYVEFANGQQGSTRVLPLPIEGGPAWIESDHYAITAKAAMHPTVEGTCVPRDPLEYPRPPKAPGDKPWCAINYRSSMQTMSGILDGLGATKTEIAGYLFTDGKEVIDKTGVQGRFDFHLEYLRGGGPPPADPDPAHAAPSIFTAVQQLGLRMEAAKGPVDVLVIDHVERPSEN